MKTREREKQSQLTVWYMCHICSRAFTNVIKLVDHKACCCSQKAFRPNTNQLNSVQTKSNHNIFKVFPSEYLNIETAKATAVTTQLLENSTSLRRSNNFAAVTSSKHETITTHNSLHHSDSEGRSEPECALDVNSNECVRKINVEVANIDDGKKNLVRKKGSNQRGTRGNPLKKTVKQKLSGEKVRQALKRIVDELIEKTEFRGEKISHAPNPDREAHADQDAVVHCTGSNTQNLEAAFLDSGVFDEGKDELIKTVTAEGNQSIAQNKLAVGPDVNGDCAANTATEIETFERVAVDNQMTQEKLSSLKLYECPVCKKIVKTRMTLHRHLQVSCRQCPTCAVKLVELNMFSLEAHVKYNPMCLPLPCHSCNASLNDCNDYMNHIYLHGLYPGYRCPFCSRFFQLDAEILNHLSTHEADTNQGKIKDSQPQPISDFPFFSSRVDSVSVQLTTQALSHVSKETDSLVKETPLPSTHCKTNSALKFPNKNRERDCDEIPSVELIRMDEDIPDLEKINKNNVNMDTDLNAWDTQGTKDIDTSIAKVMKSKKIEVDEKKKGDGKRKNSLARTDISSKLVTCPICSLSLLTKDLLLKHLTHGCQKCPSCKKRHSQLSDHFIHSDKCLPLKCIRCNQLYFSYNDLRGHALAHAYDSKYFPCQILE